MKCRSSWDVEAVFGNMVLEVGDEALKVDHCHPLSLPRFRPVASPQRHRWWSTAAVTDDDLLALLHAAIDAVGRGVYGP